MANKGGTCVVLADLVRVTEARDFHSFKRMTCNYNPVKCPAEFMGVLWSFSSFNDLRALSSLSPHVLSSKQLSTEDKVYALHYYDRCGLSNSVSSLEADVMADIVSLTNSATVDTIVLVLPLALKSTTSARNDIAALLSKRLSDMSTCDVDTLLKDADIAKSILNAISLTSDGLSKLPPATADLILSSFIQSVNSMEITSLLQFVSRVIEHQSPLSQSSVIRACERRFVSLAPATASLKDLALICHCLSDILAVEPRRAVVVRYAREVMKQVVLRKNELISKGCNLLIEESLIDFTAIFRLFREARIMSNDVISVASDILNASGDVPLHVVFRLLKYSNKVRWFDTCMFIKLASAVELRRSLSDFGARGLNLLGPICFFLAFTNFQHCALAEGISALLSDVHAIDLLVTDLNDVSLNTTILMLLWSSLVFGVQVPTASALVDFLEGKLDSRKITVNLLADVNAFIGRAKFKPLTETWMNAQAPLDARIPESLVTRHDAGFATLGEDVIIPESMGFINVKDGSVIPPSYLSLAVKRSEHPFTSFITEREVLRKLGIT